LNLEFSSTDYGYNPLDRDVRCGGGGNDLRIIFFLKQQLNILYCTKRLEREVDYLPYSNGKFKN